jgi:aspartyl-tRNA(Asn)/glutamyl-tRNA(Gln) amidotransferase subunit B
MTDTGAIEQIVDEIIKNNAPQVAQFKSGNEKILGFFVGQAMKATHGKAL